MAKEFKQFDTMFNRKEIEDFRRLYLDIYEGKVKDSAHTLKKWDLCIETWSNEYIREVVYFAEGSLDWQLFRVSMKGTTTEQKIKMLLARYVTYCMGSELTNTRRAEKCRIDNYIGALVRGGQLSVGTYEVLK